MIDDASTWSPVPREWYFSSTALNLSITSCFATSFPRKSEPAQLQTMREQDSHPRKTVVCQTFSLLDHHCTLLELERPCRTTLFDLPTSFPFSLRRPLLRARLLSKPSTSTSTVCLVLRSVFACCSRRSTRTSSLRTPTIVSQIDVFIADSPVVPSLTSRMPAISFPDRPEVRMCHWPRIFSSFGDRRRVLK